MLNSHPKAIHNLEIRKKYVNITSEFIHFFFFLLKKLVQEELQLAFRLCIPIFSAGFSSFFLFLFLFLFFCFAGSSVLFFQIDMVSNSSPNQMIY